MHPAVGWAPEWTIASGHMHVNAKFFSWMQKYMYIYDKNILLLTLK